MSEKEPNFYNQEDAPEGAEGKPEEIRVEKIVNVDEELLKQVLEVENASFPEGMRSDLEELKEILENPNGIHLIVRGKNEETLGYLSSLRQSEEYEDLKDHDPSFEDSIENLYIESIALKPSARNIKNFNKLFSVFKNMATESGYEKITMHTRVSEGLSNVAQKRGGAKFIRRIENWHDFNEPFDYLEIDLQKEPEK
jgi:hypothetical protein